MKKEIKDDLILDLLHHRLSPKYLKRSVFIFTKLVLQKVFSEIEISGLENIIAKTKSGKRLIFIVNHQSEYDWVLLQCTFCSNGIPTVMQAGDNLFVGPMNTFLRKCGAFMTIRNEKKIYSKYWFIGLLKRFLFFKPIIITKSMNRRVYLEQLKRILGTEKNHLAIFPTYEENNSGEIKYGRSYSGKHNPFSPFVLLMVQKAINNLNITNVEFVPVAISYERVPEDMIISQYSKNKFKNNFFKYFYDYFFSFIMIPFKRSLFKQKSRVSVKFGKTINFNAFKSKDLARNLYLEVGYLLKIYESHLLLSVLETSLEMPWDHFISKVIDKNNFLKNKGYDVPVLEKREFEKIIKRIEKIFGKEKLFRIKNNKIKLINSDLIRFYHNKLIHLQEDTD